MHKALLLALATGFVVGTIAPDDKVSIPVLKKARQGVKLIPLPTEPDDGEAPGKLSLSQIRTAIAPAFKPRVAGVTDLLHLDCRHMHIQGKGTLTVFFPFWIKPEHRSIRFQSTGIVKLDFTARPTKAKYLVDFQVNVLFKEAVISSSAGDMSSETTLGEGKNHVLMMIDAEGGIQTVILRLKDGFCSLRGVDVSVLE